MISVLCTVFSERLYKQDAYFCQVKYIEIINPFQMRWYTATTKDRKKNRSMFGIWRFGKSNIKPCGELDDIVFKLRDPCLPVDPVSRGVRNRFFSTYSKEDFFPNSNA